MMKIRMTALAAAAAIAAISGGASAQSAGDVVFTTDDGGVWLRTLGGMTTQLAQINDPGVRLADLAFGPGGALFVNSGPAPVENPSQAVMYRIDDPFGSANVSVLASSDPLQNPVGLVFDPNSGNLLTVNNPGTPGQPQFYIGLLGVNPTTGVVTELLERDISSFPTWNRGSYLSQVPGAPGEFFATAAEGSATVIPAVPGFSRAGSLHRLTVSGDLSGASESLIVDLGDTSVTGLNMPITRVTGVTAVDSQTLFVSAFDFDDQAGAIYRVDLDANGDFVGLQDITSGNVPQTFLPEEIEYNPFTGTLLFADRSTSGATGGNILEINLDGTGFSVFANEGRVRGIAIIPTPAGGALLAIAGLAAARRRRG
ncbi:MAG: hypothetical protein EA378_07145 [Phycisphaerales bacterium]|nr:MAG: hypothetical protein EA378_07145 [Phycisphaerales bacterium]